jgi:TonB family protein
MRLFIMLAIGAAVYAQSAWQTEMSAGNAALDPKTASEAEQHFRAAVSAAATPAEKAAALTRLGLVLEALVVKNPPSAYLKSDIEPLYAQAVELDSDAGTADHALALELYSMLLNETGRSDTAQAAKAKAAAIRQSLISTAQFGAPAPCPGPATRVGKGVNAPKLVSKVEPEYSEEARLMKYQGTAVLSVVIGTDGQIYELRLVRGLGLGLDEQAADALRKWRFEPGMAGDAPACVSAQIEVNFRLL